MRSEIELLQLLRRIMLEPDKKLRIVMTSELEAQKLMKRLDHKTKELIAEFLPAGELE